MEKPKTIKHTIYNMKNYNLLSQKGLEDQMAGLIKVSQEDEGIKIECATLAPTNIKYISHNIKSSDRVIFYDNTGNMEAYHLKKQYLSNGKLNVNYSMLSFVTHFNKETGTTTGPTTETDPIFLAQKAQPNGVATLDATGKVPTTQLPTNIAETAAQTPSTPIVADTTHVAIPSTNVQGAIDDLSTAIKSIVEIDPLSIKKAGLNNTKILLSTATTGTDGIITESTITKAALESQLVAPYVNSLTLDARLTAIETAQPSFDDVIVVATLPAVGETGKQYIVTTGANKGQTFYWDGLTYQQADQDVAIFANLLAFPATGEDGKVYVAKDTKKSYIWDGTLYSELSVVPAITNVLSSSTNTLTSTINGAISSTPIINTNTLTTNTAGELISTVNGVASVPLILKNADNEYKLGYEIGAGSIGQLLETIEHVTIAKELIGVSGILVSGTSANVTCTIESTTGTVYGTVIFPTTTTPLTTVIGTVNIASIPTDTKLVLKNSVSNPVANILITLLTK